MTDLLLGVDIGTSAVKAGVFSPDGTLLGSGRAACSWRAPAPGHAEADPEEWLRAFGDALGRACDDADIAPSDIAAVGADVLFPAVMLLDDENRPLSPAVLYNDARSLPQVARIEKTFGRDAYERRTGNRLVPGTCAAPGVLWLRDALPDAWNAASCVAWANTCVAASLTGVRRVDPTMLALSGLADIEDPWRWCDDLLDGLGIDADMLPRPVAPSEVTGGVTAEAARRTGLREGVPVVCGCGDIPSAAFGAGATTGRTALYSAGSSDCVALPLPRPARAGGWVNCCHPAKGTWLAIGTTTSSGASVEWCARQVLGFDGPDAAARLGALAAESPPGANGLLFLPYLQGERTPVWDPKARGVFLGLSLSTTRADMARATLEGVALGLRHVFAQIDAVADEPPEDILLTGGGAESSFWNGIKASVLGRPLRVPAFRQTGTLGAALLAGVGAGVHASLDDAAEIARRVVSAGDVVEPDEDATTLYDERFAVFADAWPTIADLSHRLLPDAEDGAVSPA